MTAGGSFGETFPIKILPPVSQSYTKQQLENMNVIVWQNHSDQDILFTAEWHERNFPFYRRSFAYESHKQFVPKNAWYRIYTMQEGMEREV